MSLLRRSGVMRIQSALANFNVISAELSLGAEQAAAEAAKKIEEVNALRVEISNLDLAREQALKAVAGIDRLLNGG